MPVRAAPAAALLLAGLVVAGCSNTQSSANRQPYLGSATASLVDGVQQITLRASDYRFQPSTITVHPGQVRVIVVNEGQGAPHDWQLPTIPLDYVPLASGGQTKQATFTAPAPGRYQFVCTIHRNQGMTGTLVVTP